MKNIIKPIVGLFILSSLACVSCTDTESLEINRPTVQEQNPEAYAKYLANLCGYKSAEHKMVYAWFDNSTKTPSSPAHHITNVPDSVDVISMTSPDLAEFEKADIEAVHQKGTKVVYTISFDGIKANYDALKADEETQSLADFDIYLKSEMDKLLAYAPAFDGLIAGYVGQNPEFMADAAKAEYKKYQDVFLTSIKTWKDANKGKLLVWMGKPQNLITRTILADCENIILDTNGVKDTNQLRLMITKALAENVPTDNLVFAVSTTSADASNKEVGYWESLRALSEVAYWVTIDDTRAYVKAGIAIGNVQNDYYATGGAYTYVREAINIMNPSPVK